MKNFIKIIKILFTILFLVISIGIIYFMALSPKEERFKIAEYSQGSYFSQTMFEILKFQHADYSKVYVEQSVAFNKRGEYAKGFDLLDKGVELDPELHLGYRGWIKLRKLRDYDGALNDFNRLDSLTPKFVDAPWGENIDFLRGECYFGKKNYKKAIENFNINVANNKEDWVDIYTFVYLGLCEYELGNYEKSISEFERALKQYEFTPESNFGIAKAFEKLGEVDKARENLLKAEKNIGYKRNDDYNEFLNEIYLPEIIKFKQELNKK